MTFGIGTFEHDGGQYAGVLVDNTVHDLRPHFGDGVTVRALLQDWDTALPQLHVIAAEANGGIALGEVRALPPIQDPSQIICVGANYYRHVTEIVFTMLRNSGDSRSDEELREFAAKYSRERSENPPFFFLGLPSALAGANDDIVLWGPHREHDWELELAVVIGRPASRVPVDDAMSYVAGYTISNDITVRDAMNRTDIPMTDFVASKNRPTYFPTGPAIVPAEFVDDPRELRLTLSVNGLPMQDELVADIIKGVPELISAASHAAPLAPGDLILTGSPAGNAGRNGNRWLVPGDVIEASITGLGRQRNTCVAPPD